MKDPVKLLALSGSTRTGSYNAAILRAAASAAEKAGALVEVADLRDYEMPIFGQDLEAAQGLPESAVRLKAKLREADGLILASPEYNSAFSPLLKNAIDWCSRAASSDEPPLACYAGKSALLLSASPGPLGGIRGLYALRSLLQNILVTVHPEMLAVRSAHEAIGADGSVSDPRWAKKIDELAQAYVPFAARIAG
jgi:chromate reductase, NAD(P)H dehydrogenase (quinone)